MNVLPWTYKFTLSDIMTYGAGCCMNVLNNVIRGKALEPGRVAFGFDDGFTGVLGELAASIKAEIRYIPTCGESDKKQGDVLGVQLRSSMHPRSHLIIKDGNDNPDQDYLLVRILGFREGEKLGISQARAVLVGWINGRAAQKNEWYYPIGKEHPIVGFLRSPSWVVPPDKLELREPRWIYPDQSYTAPVPQDPPVSSQPVPSDDEPPVTE